MEKLISLAFWLRIMISPTLIGAIIGAIVWLNMDGMLGKIIASALTLIGIVAGIILAEKARQGKGTVEFMAKVNASSELDKKDEK